MRKPLVAGPEFGDPMTPASPAHPYRRHLAQAISQRQWASASEPLPHDRSRIVRGSTRNGVPTPYLAWPTSQMREDASKAIFPWDFGQLIPSPGGPCARGAICRSTRRRDAISKFDLAMSSTEVQTLDSILERAQTGVTRDRVTRAIPKCTFAMQRSSLLPLFGAESFLAAP